MSARWHTTTQRMFGAEVEPVIVPDRGDRRFKDAAWNENALFDFIKQSYLLSAKYLLQVASQKEGLNDKTQQKLEFYTRQFVEMMAPSNFVAHQPRGPARHPRHPRREPALRPQEDARGPRPRQGQASRSA